MTSLNQDIALKLLKNCALGGVDDTPMRKKLNVNFWSIQKIHLWLYCVVIFHIVVQLVLISECPQQLYVGNMRLIGLSIKDTRQINGHLVLRNDRQPTCTNAVCGNQTLKIKHCLVECPHWRDSRK